MKLKEIKNGTIFTYAGHKFTKLTDEKNSCYCLLNETLFESEFGETNDWAKSPIRKLLNAFDENGNSKAISGIKKEDLVVVSLNYYSYKNPNGRVKDKITLLSWEEWYAYYYAYDFDISGYRTWLRSGYYGYAYYAYVLNSSGDYNGNYTNGSYGVRPALHLKKDIEVEE